MITATWTSPYSSDQARGQDGWILAKFFFCLFIYRDKVEVHKQAKKEGGQYRAILTEQAWSIKDIIQSLMNLPRTRGKSFGEKQSVIAGGKTAPSCPLG